jgi:hypothetical protein
MLALVPDAARLKYTELLLLLGLELLYNVHATRMSPKFVRTSEKNQTLETRHFLNDWFAKKG